MNWSCLLNKDYLINEDTYQINPACASRNHATKVSCKLVAIEYVYKIPPPPIGIVSKILGVKCYLSMAAVFPYIEISHQDDKRYNCNIFLVFSVLYTISPFTILYTLLPGIFYISRSKGRSSCALIT